jgi:hypothetical protein
MNREAQRDDYITRDAILKLLSDDEVARVATSEAGGPLAVGDEYIELGHLDHGVRRMRPTTPLPMSDVLARRSVHDSTWSQICARLAPRHPTR